MDLLDRVGGKMLAIKEELFSKAYVFVEGKFRIDVEFEGGVFDEIIMIKGFIEDYAGDGKLELSEAHLKIIDILKQDLCLVADADSGDYEWVASDLSQTNLLEGIVKVAILEEYLCS